MTQPFIKHGEQLALSVDQHEPKQRIDQFLHSQFPMYSRSFFQRAIDDNYVKVNDQIITKGGHIIKPGDQIEVTFPPKRNITQQMVEAAELPVNILFEHPHFIIINKPAGLLVHPTTSTCTAITLADWIAHTLENIKDIGYVDRPGIIHRLDKLTSGLMVIPRTHYGYGQFGSLFRDRKIKKTYYALVKGHPPKKGTIDLFIGRHPIERTKMATFQSKAHYPSSGTLRHAITHYEVEQYYEDAAHEDTALVKIHLETGRTHQIRVHFAAIGHPVIGDSMYGTTAPHMKRQALHAQGLDFTFDNQSFSFESDLPEDMKTYIAKLKPITD